MAAATAAIQNLVFMLNQPNYASYHSPPAGPLIPAGGVTPYNSLTKGARLLISIADSLHDLNTTVTKANVTHTGPGVLTLKAWCRNLISRLPPRAGMVWQQPQIVAMVDTIYRDPELFVQRYLYYHDRFYYTNYQYINESLPVNIPAVGVAAAAAAAAGAGAAPYHFLILTYPNEGIPISKLGTSAAAVARINYSKLSASILYKIYEKLCQESNWNMTSGIPPSNLGRTYPRFITGTDGKSYRSIWYSRDQLAPNKIFEDYDCETIVQGPKFDGLTNWYMWVGYAAQYDRHDPIDADEVAKLYCDTSIANQCNYTQNIRTNADLSIDLANNEAVLGIRNITLNANTFTWRPRRLQPPAAAQYPDQDIAYNLNLRYQMKTYLASAIGHVQQAGRQNAPNLFENLFSTLQKFAIMIDIMCPNICRRAGTGHITGLNFQNGGGVSRLFPEVNAVQAAAQGANGSGIEYRGAASRRYDAMSLFTDFKRVGDYLQAKEVWALQALKESPMPLLTHDAILAAISHKIFNNHTVWFKPWRTDRTAIYIVMLPHHIRDPYNLSLRINKTTHANSKLPNLAKIDATQPHGLRLSANPVPIQSVINNINAQYPGRINTRMWGGTNKKKGKGKGTGNAPHAVDQKVSNLGVEFKNQSQRSHINTSNRDAYARHAHARDAPATNIHKKNELEIKFSREPPSINTTDRFPLEKAYTKWMSKAVDAITNGFGDVPKFKEDFENWLRQKNHVQGGFRVGLDEQVARGKPQLTEEEATDLINFFIAYYNILCDEVLKNNISDTYGDVQMENNESASAAIIHMNLLYLDHESDMKESRPDPAKDKSAQKKRKEGEGGRERVSERELQQLLEEARAVEREIESQKPNNDLDQLLDAKVEEKVAEFLSFQPQNLPELTQQQLEVLRDNLKAIGRDAQLRHGGDAAVEAIDSFNIRQVERGQLGGKDNALVGKYKAKKNKNTTIYLVKIDKLKETNKILKKNKIKNKNKIEKNNKLILKLKEQNKKEKEKLKAKTKKEKQKKQKQKEKEKEIKQKEKEREIKQKEKAKEKKEKTKKSNTKTKK